MGTIHVIDGVILNMNDLWRWLVEAKPSHRELVSLSGNVLQD
jgi:hypothetical protein